MKYTNKDIVQMLRNFKELERTKKQLAFELEHYADKVTAEDIIESMTFNSGGENVARGTVSDKTASIAAAYAERAKRVNAKEKKLLESDLKAVELEIKRLTYYTGLLDEKKAKAVKLHYFDGMTIAQTAAAMNLSEPSIKLIIRGAVSALLKMFNLIF